MNKLISRKLAVDLVADLKETANKIVFTNGCFDILHAGHVRYLNAAKRCGDILIVGLNADSSVKALKGDTRPVNNEQDRAEVLSALAAVDYVVVFGERTATELIEELKPAVYVKGGDYTGQQFPERMLVENYGGQVVFIPMLAGRSTTATINRMQAAQQ